MRADQWSGHGNRTSLSRRSSCAFVVNSEKQLQLESLGVAAEFNDQVLMIYYEFAYVCSDAQNTPKSIV